MIIDDYGENTSLYDSSNLFEPFSFVKVNGRQGAGLLYLRDQFDVLSLFTLAIGVREIEVELTGSPEGCFNMLDVMDAEKLLRETVMNGLNINNTDITVLLDMNDKDQVCNMHVLDKEGYADFKYYCCRKNLFGNIECKYLSEDFWVNILLYIIVVLQVLMLLFAPIYIPEAYYRLKDFGVPYMHKLSDNVKIHLNIMMTRKPENFKGEESFKVSKFKRMPRFKNTLNKLQFEVPYQIELGSIHLRAKEDHLLPEHVIPVGLWNKLYETFVMCNLRKNGGFTKCCYANVCIKSPCGVFVTWYKVLRGIMMFFTAIVFVSPWIIRVALYFFFEHEDMDMRKKAAYDKNLDFWFPGNYTLYVTPIHISFIIIYVLLSLEYCLYGVLGEKVKSKFKYVLNACFRDMRIRDKGEVIGWAINLALLPCTRFGFFGIFICLILWVVGLPIFLLFLAFYLLPTVNIVFRLAAHFLVYSAEFCLPHCGCKMDRCKTCFLSFDPEEIITKERVERDEKIMKSSSNRIVQLIVILFSAISLFSILFLLTELVAVIVEIIVYTLMGLILNASKTLAFVSLVFLLGVYGSECFGHVRSKFLHFNKVLNKAILSLGEKKCEELMYLPPEEQANSAFMLSMENSSKLENPIEIIEKGFHPRWRVDRMVLFFSRYDVPQIPEKLFFQACKMPFDFVPGAVLKNYVQAAIEFSVILVFLIFVFLVVIAFGDTYQISTSNQLLATVVGGLLPKLLQKVFKSHEIPTIDEKSIQFKIFLYELLERYTHDWPVYDFIHEEGSDPKQMESFGNQRRGSDSSSNSCCSSSSAYHSYGVTTSNDDVTTQQTGDAIDPTECQPVANKNQENQPKRNSDVDVANGDVKVNEETQTTATENCYGLSNVDETQNEIAEEESETTPLIKDVNVSHDKNSQTESKTKIFSFNLLIDATSIDSDDFPELSHRVHTM